MHARRYNSVLEKTQLGNSRADVDSNEGIISEFLRCLRGQPLLEDIQKAKTLLSSIDITLPGVVKVLVTHSAFGVRDDDLLNKRNLLTCMQSSLASQILRWELISTPENQKKLALDIISQAMDNAISSHNNTYRGRFLGGKHQHDDLIKIKVAFDAVRNDPSRLHDALGYVENFKAEAAKAKSGFLAAHADKKFDEQAGSAVRCLGSLMKKERVNESDVGSRPK